MIPAQINTIQAKANGVLEDIFCNFSNIELPISLSSILMKIKKMSESIK
jgi:hypothetical protein